MIGATGAITGIFLLQLLVLSHRIAATENRIDRDFEAERNSIAVDLTPIWLHPTVEHLCCTRGPVGTMLPFGEFPRTNPRVAYPELARQRAIGGYVDLEYTLEPEGSVGDVKLISEVPKGCGFAASALEAFRKWKFQPPRSQRLSGSASSQNSDNV